MVKATAKDEVDIDKEFNSLFGMFADHLASTHGIPLQIFRERYIDKGYFKLSVLFKELNRHRDFRKKLRQNGNAGLFSI